MTNIPPEILARLKFKKVKKGEPEALPVLEKILHEPKQCEDCGRRVKDRRVEIKRSQFPEPHWREHCVNCSLWRNPETNKFDLNNMTLNRLIITLHRKKA